MMPVAEATELFFK